MEENLNHFSNKPQNPHALHKNQQDIHYCQFMEEPKWLKKIKNPEMENFQNFPLFEDGYRNDLYYDNDDFAALNEEQDFIRERELEFRKIRRSKLLSDYFYYREEYFNKFKPMTEEAENIRSNIKVLIMIGKISITKYSDYFDIENYNDLSTALLIRHLFHFFYGISYDSILITSSYQENFNPFSATQNSKYVFNSEIISYIFDQIQSINGHRVKSYLSNREIMFEVKETLNELIHPFKDILNNPLSINSNTELFIFIIDHSKEEEIKEQIENDMSAFSLFRWKHIYIFHDTNYFDLGGILNNTFGDSSKVICTLYPNQILKPFPKKVINYYDKFQIKRSFGNSFSSLFIKALFFNPEDQLTDDSLIKSFHQTIKEIKPSVYKNEKDPNKPPQYVGDRFIADYFKFSNFNWPLFHLIRNKYAEKSIFCSPLN